MTRKKGNIPSNPLKNKLEKLYAKYNHRRFVHPDPLEFLYGYQELADREIVGLIAAALAYGRVAQILKSVATALAILGPSPSRYVNETDGKSIRRDFAGFVHRFARAENMTALLLGIKKVNVQYGSLHACFLSGLDPAEGNVLSALTGFAGSLSDVRNTTAGHLVALPEKGSACKRLNLFLRWMIRSDAVDPGGWDGVPVSKLIVPLDVHMHRAGVLLGFTKRKSADMRTALEITECFKKITPQDPIRYDFSLTRLGIRSDMDLEAFLKGL